MARITLQATGFPPTTVEATELARHREMLGGDKRGVELAVYRLHHDGSLLAVLVYVTSWGQERTFTRLRSIPPNLTDQHSALADWVRQQAPDILPPGAGFPITPAYETRQAKLRGLMETLTLDCLTKVLADLS